MYPYTVKYDDCEYKVVNIFDKAIQSAWPTLMAAHSVAKQLNIVIYREKRALYKNYNKKVGL